MTLESITADISSSVALKALCSCDGRSSRVERWNREVGTLPGVSGRLAMCGDSKGFCGRCLRLREEGRQPGNGRGLPTNEVVMGRTMAEQKVTKNTRQSPWKFGGLGPKDLGKRIWDEFNDDNVLDGAAMLAYYFFFALFPMLIFLMSMLGIVGGQGIGNNVVDQITRIMPASASTIVHETMKQALKASDSAKLSFGILITLWSAAAGMTGLMAALNNVFEVRETRSFLKTKAIAVGLTVGNSLIVLVGIALLLYGGNIADHFLAGQLNIVWKVVQYPLAIFFLLLSYSTIYYYAPNIEHPHWAWEIGRAH